MLGKRGEVNISGGADTLEDTMVLWKGKTDTFFISQTLVLSIKLATVNLIPYFGVSTVIILSHGYLPQVVQVEL